MDKNQKTNGIHTDTALAVAILIISGLLLWVSYQYQDLLRAASQFGVMFWPRLLLWAMVMVSCGMLVAPWLGIEPEPEEGKAEPSVLTLPSKSFIFTLFVCFVYIVLIHYTGFMLAGLIFTIVIVKWIWMRNWTQALTFSTLWSFFLWAMFIKLLHVPLPKGVGIFRQISVFLY